MEIITDGKRHEGQNESLPKSTEEKKKKARIIF